MEAPTSPPDHHFLYWGRPVPYFYHLYNLTHINERAVEVALAFDLIDSLPQDSRSFGVEVGNVLGHYRQCRHEVIDLTEEASWYQKLVPQYVYNWDILDPMKSLNGPWVISISTIEHTRDPLRALDKLRGMVDPGGRLLVTFPTGAHRDLDELVSTGDVDGHRLCTFQRHSSDDPSSTPTWTQDPRPTTRPYGPWAQSLAVLEWERPL